MKWCKVHWNNGRPLLKEVARRLDKQLLLPNYDANTVTSIEVFAAGPKRWIIWTGMNLLREGTALAACHLLAHVEGAAFISIDVYLNAEINTEHGQVGALNPLVVDELHQLSPNRQYRVNAKMVCRGSTSSSTAIDELSLRTAAQLGTFQWASDRRGMVNADTCEELSSMLHTTRLCRQVMINAGRLELAVSLVDVSLCC